MNSFFVWVDITGGPAMDEYQFLQFHMHWGADNDEGSEHVIDGIRLPAEVRKYSCSFI
jgi:carbonic anhydrase